MTHERKLEKRQRPRHPRVQCVDARRVANDASRCRPMDKTGASVILSILAANNLVVPLHKGGLHATGAETVQVCGRETRSPAQAALWFAAVSG